MSYEADTHNFGQQVTRLDTASGKFFRKPRPVFWEWFFFGNNSPLKEIYKNCVLAPWFNLDVEFEANSFCGRVREVEKEPSKILVSQTDLFNFGSLLAYAYIFGIRDLTIENVIRTSDFLQPVDTEIVFAKLILPQETFLIPYRDVALHKTALGIYYDSIEQISTEDGLAILTGFCQHFQYLIEHLEHFEALFKLQTEVFRNIPVRHIFQDTWKYKDWKTKLDKFIPEEIKQLVRGDIPYFYKLIGKPDLFCHSPTNRDFKTVIVPEHLCAGVEREAVEPMGLISRNRLNQELLPTGILYLAKYFLKNLEVGKYEICRDISLSIEVNSIKLKNGKLSYSTRLLA